MGRGITPQIARKIRAEKGLGESKLYKMRLKEGLSQEQLSKKAGVPVRTIRSFEQYEVAIENTKLTTLCDICIALNCRFEDIIESDEVISKIRMIERGETDEIHRREDNRSNGRNDP